MLLQCIGSPLEVDGVPIVQDVRLLLKGSSQLRLKANFPDADGLHPPTKIDVIVYRYTKISVDGLTLSLEATGEEKYRNLKFKFRLSYHLLKKEWKVAGRLQDREVKESHKSLVSLIKALQTILTKTN